MKFFLNRIGKIHMMSAALLRRLPVLASLILLNPADAAPVPGEASLSVQVSGVANNKGKILAAVCDRASFLKRCAHTVSAPAAASVTLKFPQLAPGNYAVMVFHDENDNMVFDKSASGLPLEGYGFSRNAKGHYGPPGFEDAMIELKPGPASIQIVLLY